MIPAQHISAPIVQPDGFQSLVGVVTRNGELNPDFPMQCENHSSVANDPGCVYPPEPGFWEGWGRWLLSVFIYD